MKRKLLSTLLVLCIVLALMPVTVQAAETSGSCGDGVTWSYSNGTLTIQGTGRMTDYVSSFDSSLFPPWYSYRDEMHTVIIGEGVTSIGDIAFDRCQNLTNLTIPNSVTSIGMWAFSNCSSLTSVTIPSSVTTIRERAFLGCSSLTSINVASGNIAYTSVDGILFNADQTLLHTYPARKSGVSYNIPTSVTIIETAAFYGCSSLTSVTIPNSVTSIGSYVFYGCSSLTSITIPNGFTGAIGDAVFSDCSSLTSVTIPNNVTVIGYYAFHGCIGLPSVTIPDSVIEIYSDAFSDCNGLTSVTIPDSVITIENRAFSGCSSLTDVYYSGSETDWKAISIGRANSDLTNAKIHYNSAGPKREDNVSDNPTSKVAETISDETILRAKLLTADHSFDFYRKWDSPVQIMAELLDPTAAVAWYSVENLIDMYYKSVKSGDSVADVTVVEFYEYLLFKLLDSEELKYFSVTEPFGLIDDLSNQNINGAFLKKLLSTGFKAGTKITDENLNDIKNWCISICGANSVTDIGWMDAILVPGKTIDVFVTEFIKLYALTTVSDARAEAIRMIRESAQVPALQTAADNVYKSVQQAKKDGIDYCVSGSVEASLDNLNTWILDKIVDNLCDIHPVSKIWKATADGVTLTMDTIFLTDDISTDTIYILGMANVERAILSAIDRAEESFQNHMTVENAQQLIALADTLKRETLVGCDLIIAQVNHCERSDLNWNGILDLISMIHNEEFDFPAIMRWIWGDSDSSYAKMRKSLTDIKKNVENTNFYTGSVSILELLREVKSTTPSTWASAEINKAINYGILPEWMQNNYQNNLTRIEFCALLEYMIEVKTGKTVLQLADELAQKQSGYSKAPFKPPFDDALYMEVNDIARLGIISGVGSNMFNPLGEITRQEAATILYRTANVLGYDTTSKTTDHSEVADWAAKGVDFVITKGIMVGTDKGFEPEGKYTKEQSILTLVRFFEYVN